MLTELIVELPSHTASLDLLGDVPVSLNYAVADIKEMYKRNGAFSKSIKLPGSATNNKFFEHTYNVNISTNLFNPNLKTPCYISQDSIEVFRGYLRLREIEVEMVNDVQNVVYDVTILGDNQDLFGLINDSKLQDLDMSEFDHIYNRINQYASWSASTGSGYVYPLIDYGYNSFLTNSFSVENFRPAFYVKTYIDKIFASVGKTYTSSFLTSAFFKTWIIPHNGEKFTMSAANLEQYECYVGDTGLSTPNSKNLTYVGSTNNAWWTGDNFASTAAAYTMAYNDDTTNPFIDTGNIYNTTTGILTIAQKGTYNLSLKTDFEIKLSAVPAGTATINFNPPYANSWALSYKVLRSTDGGVTWSIILNDMPNFQSNIITTSYQTITKTISVPTTSFDIGDQIRVLVHPLYSASGYGLIFKDGGGTPINAGTATLQWRFRATATMKTKLSIGDYISGQSLVINDAIPKDIKQKDFLVSILRAGRLFVSPDPNDNNNYIIQTRNEYYAGGSTIDWSDKLALDMPYTVSFPAEIDVKNFIYRYKSDSDYYNKKYEGTYQEPYGSYKKVVANDFTLRDEITELIFSPTPIVDNTNNSMIIPKIFSYDGTLVKPQKHNIRLLMYNGVDTLTAGTWNYVAPSADALGTAVLPMSIYPQSAMVNNPLNPTASIEFGVPNTVFYSPDTYTTNNIFNREYSQEISEVTDRDARIVTCYFYLKPIDIAKFDFKNSIYVKDTYFFDNKLSDYNKLKPGLTKAELLKITNKTVYEPVYGLPLGVIETNSTAVGMTARYAGSDPTETNFGGADNVLLGDNNSSRSVGSYISGSRNAVSIDTTQVTIIGSSGNNVGNNCDRITLTGGNNNNVGGFCEEITLINCKNCTVEEGVINFTGTNLDGFTVTVAMNGTSQVGTLTTFQGTGTTL